MNIKKIFFLLFFIFLASACAMNTIKFSPVTVTREVASIERCVLVRHDKEDLYQLRIDNRPADPIWYDFVLAQKKLQEKHKSQLCH